MRLIFKSRIISVSLAILLVLGMASGVWAEHIIRSWGIEAEGVNIENVLGKSACVVSSEKKLDDIRIINGYQEYFLEKEAGKTLYYMVDADGRKLMEGKAFIDAGDKTAGLIPLKETNNETVWTIIDCETLEKVVSVSFDDVPEIHRSGNYMLGTVNMGEEERYKIVDLKGNVIYESKDQLVLPSEEGYLIENRDGRSYIVDFRTGKTLYSGKKHERIIDGRDGNWVIRYGEDVEDWHSCEYVLDSNFDIACGGQLFSGVYLRDGWIAGDEIVDKKIEDLEETLEVFGFTIESALYDKNGKKLDSWGNGITFKGALDEENVLIMGDKGQYSFYDLENVSEYTGRRMAKAEEFNCYMDFQDGYALARIPVHSWLGNTIYRNEELSYDDTSDYRWTYVDEDMKPVSKFVFTKATLSENGYGAVMTEEGMYLIDLFKGQR